jgi:hypothetical protein
VTDASGNAIETPVVNQFTGTTTPDVTAPTLVSRSPAPGATGVGVAQPVLFQLSEPVNSSTVVSGTTWDVAGGGSAVNFQFQSESSTYFALVPQGLLALGTQYTVTLDSIVDFAGNALPTTSWSFTTSPNADTTPPTVVSSVPANNATNVNTGSNLSITFSEAVNQVTFQAQVTPSPGDGTATWSGGGKSVTFDPDAPLATNQQYTVSILPGGIEDLSGNKNTQIVTIVFSTGSTLVSGSIAGNIAGDPGTAAADPTGAIVAAATSFIFQNDDVNILGSDVVAGNDSYRIRHLPDGVYYPLAVMDTNGDNELDPSKGDAVGLYGIDFAMGDFTPDSLTIAGGAQLTAIDFPLLDTSAIAGTLSYTGGLYAGGSYPIYVGVFDVVGFDPTATPYYGTEASWPYDLEFTFSSLEDGLADGMYYVAAYMDVNLNAVYDPGTDPAGYYGGGSPQAINIANGSDAVGLAIVLNDPVVPSRVPASGMAWPKAENHAPWLKKLSEAIRRDAGKF